MSTKDYPKITIEAIVTLTRTRCGAIGTSWYLPNGTLPLTGVAPVPKTTYAWASCKAVWKLRTEVLVDLKAPILSCASKKIAYTLEDGRCVTNLRQWQ